MFSFCFFLFLYEVSYSQPPVRNKTIEEEVVVKTKDSKFTLSGSLKLPGKDKKYPAVILICGTGPHKRECSISGSPMFDQLANFFLAQNIAVLQTDKRGFGKSTGPTGGSEDSTTTGDLVDDMDCWFKLLRSRKDIDTTNIGLYGHSEGGIIAPMLTSREAGIKWLILVAPSAVPGDKISLEQMHFGMVRNNRLKGDTLTAVFRQFERLIAFVKTDDFANKEKYFAIGHDFLAAHGLPEEKNTRKLVDQVLSDYATPWFHYFLNLDPEDYLRQLKIPVLCVFSPADEEVFLDQNLLPFAQAIGESRDNDITVSIIPGQDHFFLTYEGKRQEQHKFGKMEVSPALLDAIKKWIASRVKNDLDKVHI